MSAIPMDGTQRLLFFLTQRLAQLNWSREDLAAQGGPSPSTVYKASTAGRRPSERTLARLELALGWQPGSAHHVMTGGAPSVSMSTQFNSTAVHMDSELARTESAGVARTARQLRQFLLGVAEDLERFYAGPANPGAEVTDAGTR